MLTIVTVSFSNIEELISTCESVDSQSVDANHMIVASGYSVSQQNILLRKFSSNLRCFLFDHDSGLYNAMNIALSHLSTPYVFFLNAGDIFLSVYSLACIFEYVHSHPQKHIVFPTIQYFQDLYFYRPPLIRRPYMKSPSIAHQGFVAFLPGDMASRCRFDENRSIDADYFWILSCIKYGDFVISYIPISLFALGGLSNLPSWRMINKFFVSANYSSAILSLAKYVLCLFVGPRKFFMIMYSFYYLGSRALFK